MTKQIGILALAAVPLLAQSDWPSYGRDPGGQRFSPLREINTRNIQRLRQAWVFHTGDFAVTGSGATGRRNPAFEATPLMIDDVLYFSTPANRVIALRAETGDQLWAFDPHAGRASKVLRQHRGVAYWASGKDRRILFGTSDGRLMAIDASTGKPCRDFGDNGEIRLHDDFHQMMYSINSPPAIYRDLAITSPEVPEYPGRGPSGKVRAFNVRTGKLVWTFHTVPQPGESGFETWEGDSWKERTGANVWSMMSVDTEHGMVFLPIGSPSYDFYGGDRKGQNLYGNSLVALDAATGKLIWHYQFIHHDLWDYDLPAQPVLADLKRGGRTIPAVVQVTKTGFVFVLDRVTGKPLFPIEERLVPQSDVPGERTWPTQPFPVKPPPLSRMMMTRDDITDVTPESRKYCLELFDSLTHKGPFTPGSQKLTLAMPGTLGGATWSGGSFDSESGLFFVNTNEVGAVGMLAPQPADSPTPFRRTSPKGEYARFWDENEWPCQKPPWGLLNAINLNTGEISWRKPLGIIDELTARGVPQTGTPSLGGSIVTAGGLIFIAGTNDHRFRAFESQTGKELWVADIGVNGHATPMTYRGKNGKQYVVIAAGGGGYFGKAVGDSVIAFALPDG